MVVVTELMKRVQATPMAKEIAFIDSTGHVDRTLSTITVITTATKAGALPIIVLITKRQTESNFRQAFALARTHYPTAFGGNIVSFTNDRMKGTDFFQSRLHRFL